MTRRGVFQLELVAALTLMAAVCLVGMFAFGSAALKQIASTSVNIKPKGTGVEAVSKIDASPHYVGIAAGGCAAANCHGGQNDSAQPGGEWKTSAFVFLQHDPHAQAYNVLFEDRSRQLIDRLARWETTPDGGRPAPQEARGIKWYIAQLQDKCVSCHATPLPEGTASSAEAGLNHYALGVTCEACHGPASQWGDEHLSNRWQTSASQKIENPIDKEATDFNDLERLPIAAGICAKCHIGDGSQVDGMSYREVTHDFIAAGHPRLDFDFAAWYASMPPHWNRQREKRAGFCTEAWAHGQGAAVQARLALAWSKVESSYSRPRTSTPHLFSAELASYDCFACHQSLRFPPWESGYRPRQANGLPFGSSWVAFASVYSEEASLVNDDLSFLLKGERPSLPNDAFPLNVVDQLTTVRRLEKCPPYENWDELVSWYYAADAVSRDAAFAAQSSPDLQSPAKTMEASLQQLKSELEKYLARSGEVSRYASPSGFGIAKLDADGTEKPDPQAVQTAFEEAKQAMRLLAEKWDR